MDLLENCHGVEFARNILVAKIIAGRTGSYCKIKLALKFFHRKCLRLAIEFNFFLSDEIVLSHIEEVNEEIAKFEEIVSFERIENLF